jgi:hypothetical protein
MRLDAQLAFVPLGAPLSIVAGAGVAVPSTNTIDILGAGVGVAPPSIFGTATLFGADWGIGTFRPEIEMTVGTAFTTANSATLNVQLQAAPDAGTPTYQPGTWQTIGETGTITAAQLTANAQIARLPFLPIFPITTRPRFYRLNFVPAAGTNFTAGTIAFALVTVIRDDLSQKFQPKNYVVA